MRTVHAAELTPRFFVVLAFVGCGESAAPVHAGSEAGPDEPRDASTADVQGCVPIPPASLGDAFDPLPIVEKAKIAVGPYADGYLVGKGGATLNWYFASLGLLGFVDRIPNEVRGYLDLYLAHLAANASIGDVYFGYRTGASSTCTDSDPAAAGAAPAYDCPYTKTNASGQASDSDDSYAATFLSLAARYYAVTCDVAWAKKNLAVLEKVADTNLIGASYPNHLVHVFQDASAYPGAYTEDDCEDAKGLSDLASLLGALGDDAGRAKYANAAALVSSAVSSVMYRTDLTLAGGKQLGAPGFDVLWSGSPVPLSDPPAFYPDGTTQIFPEAYALDIPASEYAAAWALLEAVFPNYWVRTASSLPRYDTDPWTLIGWAAALDGNVARARDMQALTTATYAKEPAYVPLSDWGFYERITLVLEGAKPY